jgi:hypothetical protein
MATPIAYPPTGLGVTASTTKNQVEWTNVNCDYGDGSFGPCTGIRVYRRISPGSTYSNIATPSYPSDSYNDTDIGTFGTYTYYVQAILIVGDLTYISDASDTDSVARAGDTISDTVDVSEGTITGVRGLFDIISDTITLSDAETLYANYFDTISDTVTVSDALRASQSIKTDFEYYIGMSDGTVHGTDSSVKSDNGTAITSIWETMETDLGVPGVFKTVHRANLKYVDKSADTLVSVSISNDGGQTWTAASKSIGTGDGKTASKFFWYVMTGEFFKFKIELSSDDADFQITGLDIDFQPCGEVIET